MASAASTSVHASSWCSQLQSILVVVERSLSIRRHAATLAGLGDRPAGEGGIRMAGLGMRCSLVAHSLLLAMLRVATDRISFLE